MKSEELFEASKKIIPGGVNSPVRAFKSVGGNPFFTKKAKGSKLFTVDNAELTDFVSAWGPALFGHSNPTIKSAIAQALENGTAFGTPSEAEYTMASLIHSMIPCAEMVRMVNSGTEATMSCIRLARGFTKRDRIVKFSGCYHGHVDSLLVKAGSGALTFGNPDSAGIPKALAELTTVLEYNDIDALETYFAEFGELTAAVILEPYPANVGLILPQENFLKTLQSLTKKSGALLIFDEVITGFRVASGGVQAKENITPDLCALGKIIGGGLPVGAFAGRKEIMENLSPIGAVYQAGTLSGNPLAMAAGIAALNMIRENSPYEILAQKTKFMVDAISEAAKQRGVAIQLPNTCGLFSMYFSDTRVDNYSQALKSNAESYKKIFQYALKRGLFLAPSAYESCFISLAHDAQDLERAAEIIAEAIRENF